MNEVDKFAETPTAVYRDEHEEASAILNDVGKRVAGLLERASDKAARLRKDLEDADRVEKMLAEKLNHLAQITSLTHADRPERGYALNINASPYLGGQERR